MQMISDKVFVRPQEAYTKEIIIPNMGTISTSAPFTGHIIISNGSLKQGDRVVFERGTGLKMIVNDEEILVMREEDVLAIVDEEAEVKL